MMLVLVEVLMCLKKTPQFCIWIRNVMFTLTFNFKEALNSKLSFFVLHTYLYRVLLVYDTHICDFPNKIYIVCKMTFFCFLGKIYKKLSIWI